MDNKLNELAKEVNNEGDVQVFVIIAVVVAIVVVIVIGIIVFYFFKKGFWKSGQKNQTVIRYDCLMLAMILYTTLYNK